MIRLPPLLISESNSPMKFPRKLFRNSELGSPKSNYKNKFKVQKTHSTLAPGENI